jgi:hypothetical protein
MSLNTKITILERLLGISEDNNTKKSFTQIRRRISTERVSTYIKKYVSSCGRVLHKSLQWYKKCVINGLVIDLWQENMHNFEGVDTEEFYDLLEEFLIEKYGDEVEYEIKKLNIIEKTNRINEMKILISENKLKNLIRNRLGIDLTGKISMITSQYQLPMSFDSIISPTELNRILNHRGPCYLLKIGRNEYLLTPMENKDWLIITDNEWLRPFEFMRELGIEMLGLSIDDLLEMYFDEKESINEMVEGDDETPIRLRYALIEIKIPLAFWGYKNYFQIVPHHYVLGDRIYVKKGTSGGRSISTKNINVIEVFDEDRMNEMIELMNKLREKNKF